MAKKHAPQILVVDDEKDIRDITEAFLMLNGYEVDTAKNGKEALDKILVTFKSCGTGILLLFLLCSYTNVAYGNEMA